MSSKEKLCKMILDECREVFTPAFMDKLEGSVDTPESRVFVLAAYFKQANELYTNIALNLSTATDDQIRDIIAKLEAEKTAWN